MTREEAIKVLENPDVSIGVSARIGQDPEYWRKLRPALDMAISALRQQQEQENECVECSGIVYRQTNSGKIIPLGQRCGAKITPPCYVPDGDGCSYQIYGDNNDEPIDRCKSCPLCQSDKVRHKQEHFRDLTKKVEPLTLDELRQMDGEPVWIKLFDPDEEFWVLRNEWVDTRNPEPMILFHMRWYSHADYGKTWLAYRKKPEEGTV